jgi:DNA-binding LacI/PurR family transcriptional regulator
MAKRRTTSKDVAAEAGVSQTTVSFVLNNVTNANISEETQARVWDAARRLGYVPDASARSLAQGRSNNIGLVLIKPHYQVFTDPFVPNLLTGFSEMVQAQGFRVLVEGIDRLDQLDTVEHMLRGGEVTGIVIAGHVPSTQDFLMSLRRDGYPVVAIDPLDAPDACYVAIDHANGIREAAAHLVGLGHQRIACITYAPRSRPHIEERLQAFQEVLETTGLSLDERLLRFGTYDPATGYEAARSLLEHDPTPTAIWCMNDFMALGAMAAIHDQGLRIPEDIAVVGHDDMRFAQYTYPTLTTVRAPEIELGSQAAQLLLDLINNTPPQNNRLSLPTRLVVRQSCGGQTALRK